MNVLRTLYICFLLTGFAASALCVPTTNKVGKKYWIFFHDKGIAPSSFKQGSTAYEKARATLAVRSLERRKKSPIYESTGDILSIEDVPVHAPYIDSLRTLGVRPITTSRWLNAISATLDDKELQVVSALSFVCTVEPILYAKANDHSGSDGLFLRQPITDVLQTPQAISMPCGYDSVIYHYGFSAVQLARIGVPPLHALGYNAAGIMIGFLDTGFNPDGMRTTRYSNILETYDFVFRDSSVNDDINDPIAADNHGSLVLSAAIGYLPDSLVAPAYEATVYLCKTEDLRTETPFEEDLYAEGLEWLEERGADIASSSLGYLRYDPGFTSISYPMLDGKTTVAARAALMATRRGMLIVTAAGNGGKDSLLPYIMTPGDADSIITVGALFENDTIADFSSRGPTYDGRIKPEICAPGSTVMTMSRSDVIEGKGGTSLATPLVSSACALIMQAHPEATAQAVRNAILKTGSRFGPPDTAYGYGRINAYAAALELGTIITQHRQWRDDTTHHICVGLAANNKIKFPRVVYAIGDTSAFTLSTPLELVTDSLIYSTTFPAIKRGKHVRYYIEALDGADTATRSPRDAPLSYYEFNVGDTVIKDSELSVRHNDSRELISVYPNPARDKFFVSSSYSRQVRFYLSDIVGKEVLHFSTSAAVPKMEVRLGMLPGGVYILYGRLPSGELIMKQSIVRTQ